MVMAGRMNGELSGNMLCPVEVSSNAFQSNYGGGFSDMGFFICQDNVLSSSEREIEPLKIYPNPTNDRLLFELPDQLWEKFNFSIYDSSGRLMKHVSDFPSGNSLSLIDLSPGVYTIFGEKGDRSFKSKVVVTP
jgi:hypothetical protein